MPKNSIGSFIAVLRKAGGMTQSQLAQRLGVSNKTVSNWERDENAPDLSMIPIIAEIFGVSCDELLRGERISGNEEGGISARSKKEIGYLLGKAWVKFRNSSIISFGLTAAGLVGGIVFYHTIYVFSIIFGCLLPVCAVILELVFASGAFGATGSHEELKQETEDLKFKVLACTCAAVSISVSVAAFFLFDSPAFAMGMPAMGVAALCAAVCALVSAAVLVAFRLRSMPAERVRKVFGSKLFKRCMSAFLCVLILSGAAQIILNANAEKLFMKGTTFRDIESFREFAATDVVEEWDAVVCSANIEEQSENDRGRTNSVKDIYGNDIYSWTERRSDIYKMEWNGKSDDYLPVTVYTYADLNDACDKKVIMNAVFAAVYIADAAICVAVYILMYKKKEQNGQ